MCMSVVVLAGRKLYINSEAMVRPFVKRKLDLGGAQMTARAGKHAGSVGVIAESGLRDEAFVSTDEVQTIRRFTSTCLFSEGACTRTAVFRTDRDRLLRH